jgi:hypothetical protein
VEWRKEDAEAHPVHDFFLPLCCDISRMNCRLKKGSPDPRPEASIFCMGLSLSWRGGGTSINNPLPPGLIWGDRAIICFSEFSEINGTPDHQP